MEDYPAADKPDPLARESESFYKFSGSKLETLKKVWLKPARGFLSDEFYSMAGLGALYSRASSYVFGDWNKCGELMGLAPYGKPNAFPPLLRIENNTLEVPDWGAEFNKPYLLDAGQDWEKSPSMQHWKDLAWRVQDDTETVLLHRARWLRETTGSRNLCIAGGVGLNCVANGRLAREAGFDNVWIQPAAGDDGIAIGCAYYGYLALLNKPRSHVITHAYFGRTYSDSDVKDITERKLVRAVTNITRSNDICRDTAKVLSEGKVVGWFQGRSEFGPRALGNRSIIADPRTPEMKDILNKRVKHRQAFRPFAPIVIEERAAEIFEGPGDSPFMLMAKHVSPAWKDRIPSIVHVDGTARVQTVRREDNEMLYRLLKEFEALTGVPVLLNTSFNVKGEPIVERPHEAVECFLTTGIDYLAIHDLQLTKNRLHGVLSPVVKVFSDVRAIVQASTTAVPPSG
jgi:carbamoyltransferase